ncbi:MAG TPA: DUF4397 domain-containing protein [Mucilaginibacter sp.]
MNTKCSILLLIAALGGFCSCKNNDEVFAPKVITNINVVNASADTLNFYLNGTRQTNTSSLYPGGQSYYIKVPAGQQNYQFKKAGGFTDLFSMPLNLKDSTNNSLYITGESANDAFYTQDIIDTLTNFSTVRFVNAAPDAGNLDMTVGDTLSFTGKPFKSSSAFLSVGSGKKVVKIYQTGATMPIKDTTITLQPNRAYTLFAKGLLNGKGNAAFGVGTVINF